MHLRATVLFEQAASLLFMQHRVVQVRQNGTYISIQYNIALQYLRLSSCHFSISKYKSIVMLEKSPIWWCVNVITTEKRQDPSWVFPVSFFSSSFPLLLLWTYVCVLVMFYPKCFRLSKEIRISGEKEVWHCVTKQTRIHRKKEKKKKKKSNSYIVSKNNSLLWSCASSNPHESLRALVCFTALDCVSVMK